MTKPEYEVVGATVRFTRPDGRSAIVEFRWPIAQTLLIGETLVVRTAPPVDSRDGQNVHGVDENGRITWTVPLGLTFMENTSYTFIDEFNGYARLTNFDGTVLLVDARTGVVVETMYQK